MNGNRNSEWALEMDTHDLIEAVAIVAVSYASWRDANLETWRSNPSRPTTLHHVSGSQYVEIPGYHEEPQAAFGGKVMSITRLAALAIGIDRPLSPLLRCLWNRLVEQDGEEAPLTIGDFAEALVEYINVENEERRGEAVA